MHDLIDSVTASQPDKVALIFGDRSFSYRTLYDHVTRLVCGLQANFLPGDLLALWLPNGPELICLYLACLKAGIVPMPLHIDMKAMEVGPILDHARPRGLITNKTLPKGCGPDLLRKFLIGAHSAETSYRSFDGLMDCGETVSTVHRAHDDMGLVLHTSGSNGIPKGVAISYAGIEHTLRDRREFAKMDGNSLALVASCLTQSVGLYQSLALLSVGGTIVLLESYDIELLVEAIHRYQPTHLIMVVDPFDKILHHPKVSRSSFSRIIFASAGADRVTARVQNRFMELLGRPLAVTYGLTELSWAMVNAGDRIDKALALGCPRPGVEVRLVNKQGIDVHTGETGELLFRSPKVMMGYLHEPALTRETLVDGWLASGDLAYRDVDGYYWFAGRKKNLIVLHTGDNISPVEVETALLSHPAVVRCMVVGVSSPEGSETPCAYVVRTNQSVSETDLIAHLHGRISNYKIPRQFIFLSELPVGPTGKIHRIQSQNLLSPA